MTRLRTIIPRLGTVPSILLATLREIFDESAYTRFLERVQASASRQTYAEFLQENEQTRSRRPRCC